MKLLTSKKAIFCIMGVSGLVIASTYRDIKSNEIETSLLTDEKEETMPVERNLASLEAPSKVLKMDLPNTLENKMKINSLWEISRIVDSEERVVFDKFQNVEDSKKSIKVKMELIGNGIVRLDKDSEQVYAVSILTDLNTIAIYKKMGNGFEIIEARKVSSALNNASATIDANVELELVLERALNQSKGNKILTGSDVSGQLTLKGNVISNLSINLHNQNGEDQSIEIDSADIMDGGAFKADVNGEEVSGVLFNGGSEGYRLSFVTGPLAGAMLNFVTKENFDSITEKEELLNRDKVESSEEVVQAQADIIEERQVAAENLPEDQKLSVEEIKEVAQQNGFSF